MHSGVPMHNLALMKYCPGCKVDKIRSGVKIPPF